MRIPLVTPPRRVVAGIATLLAGAILLGAGPPATEMTPVVVDLGAAESFAVLAGGGITDTGPSVILGDVGTYPVPAIPDLLDREASGSVDRAGVKSQQAQRDLASAFTSLDALPQGDTVSLSDDQTLPPGVYAVSDAEERFAGSLTLDGRDAPNPVWIFVVADDLVTTPGSTIALVHGAQACNVYWLVGGSATLASGSTIAGSILAMKSVTVGSSVTIAGRLLTRTGAVSLGGDRITVPACPVNAAKAAPQPASAGAPALASRTLDADADADADAQAGGPSALSAFLPILLLVAASLMGEPRRRHGRRASGTW